MQKIFGRFLHMSKERNYTMDQLKPLGAWQYFLYQLLFSVPIVGFIFLIIFSFNNSNINRRNFARSYFCIVVILIVITVAVSASAVASGVWGAITDAIKNHTTAALAMLH